MNIDLDQATRQSFQLASLYQDALLANNWGKTDYDHNYTQKMIICERFLNFLMVDDGLYNTRVTALEGALALMSSLLGRTKEMNDETKDSASKKLLDVCREELKVGTLLARATDMLHDLQSVQTKSVALSVENTKQEMLNDQMRSQFKR